MSNILNEIHKPSFSFKILFTIIFILLALSYMIYHLYNGKYGLKNYTAKQNLINKKNITAEKAEKEIKEMKNKIDKLQDNSLDSDLLDEEIRKNTSYAKKNEIIIYSNDL